VTGSISWLPDGSALVRPGWHAQRGRACRGRQGGEQDRGIIVEPVERHPGHVTILGPRPLCEKGRLAIARGRSDADDAAIARTSRRDELGPAYRARAKLRG
jgi:hypothetical protein